MFSGYTLFWPAFLHNIIWLAWLALIATPVGIFSAVLLDRDIRGTGFYQSVFFLPVVLSLVVVGFIWELQFSPTEGFINNAFGLVKSGKLIDWLGNPRINLYSILIAASWRHVGYVMVIYLAGLKSVDPTLREAAKVDGANEIRTFFRVVFPVMAPINAVIAVITTIEPLRALDIPVIVNQGKNGLQLLAILNTNNSITEASLVGFGPAIAVILLVIAVPGVVVTLVLASMVRFACTRFRWRFNLATLMISTAGDLLPPQVMIVPLYRICLSTPIPMLGSIDIGKFSFPLFSDKAPLY